MPTPVHTTAAAVRTIEDIVAVLYPLAGKRSSERCRNIWGRWRYPAHALHGLHDCADQCPVVWPFGRLLALLAIGACILGAWKWVPRTEGHLEEFAAILA